MRPAAANTTDSIRPVAEHDSGLYYLYPRIDARKRGRESTALAASIDSMGLLTSPKTAPVCGAPGARAATVRRSGITTKQVPQTSVGMVA